MEIQKAVQHFWDCQIVQWGMHFLVPLEGFNVTTRHLGDLADNWRNHNAQGRTHYMTNVKILKSGSCNF